MKITRIETFTRGQIGIVRIATDDGATGIGQMAPSNPDISALVLRRHVAKHALGHDPLDAAALVERCMAGEYKYPGTYVCRALAGVDTACWDLRGKLERKSVCQLLGGQPKPLPVYASSMRRDIKPVEEAQRIARLRDAHGFAACKVKIGRRMGRDQDEWPGRTEALIATVRKTLGDTFTIYCDANSCYTPKKAIEVGRMLQDHRLAMFEEPCPYEELEWTAEVAAALDIPVSGGEQDHALPTWRRMFRLKAVDVAQPDVGYVGGFTRALEVARLAHAAGLSVVPHNSNHSLIAIFTAHLLAAIPNAGPHMEFGIEPSDLSQGLYRPALTVKNGHVTLPAAPGWGIDLDPAWLANAERTVIE